MRQNIWAIFFVFLFLNSLIIFTPSGSASHTKTVTCSPSTKQDIVNNTTYMVEYELDLNLTPGTGTIYWVGFTADAAPNGWARKVYKKGDPLKKDVLNSSAPPDANHNNWNGWISMGSGAEIHFYAILEVKVINQSFVKIGQNATIVVHCWSCDIVPNDLEDDPVKTITTYNISSINITTLTLLENNSPTNIIYPRLSIYTFRTNIIDTVSLNDLKDVQLNLDSSGTKIQLLWNRSSDQFVEIFDPNDYVTLNSNSKAYNDSKNNWTVDFNITFNWTYPGDNLHDVQVNATSFIKGPVKLNAADMYCVENDLIFNGTLSIKDKNNRSIFENDLVRGGEKLIWTGLKVVYENTTDIFPPDNEFNITIWDEHGNFWYDSPASGKNFTIKTTTPFKTNLVGETYIINISEIPQECDNTNETFVIRIDGDTVIFSNPIPDNISWQTSLEVNVGITIKDYGGGLVNGSSVMKCISLDNGSTWANWEMITDVDSDESVLVQDAVILEDGTDNLIKWRAKDSFGNGPTQSSPYCILVDTQNVIFINSRPLETEVSTNEQVEVGITILDNISGVDANSIEYAISIDNGVTWDSWFHVNNLEDEMSIEIVLNLTFSNGTANRIKWRASDIAGNGPTESDIYVVKVNSWKPKFIPKIQLIKPDNNSVISNKSIELKWKLLNPEFENIKYIVYFDFNNPPIEIEKSNHNGTSLIIKNLTNFRTYYWTIIPTFEDEEGVCISGIWSFSVNISIPVPKVNLITPANNTILYLSKPTLIWLLNYNESKSVKYDIYLGNDSKPNLKVKDYIELKYTLDEDLQVSQIYYWYIIPKTDEVIGQKSDTWSFKINISVKIPSVILKLPINGTKLNNTKPTLSWTSIYHGTETLTYDIYLDTNPNSSLKIQGYLKNQYFPNEDLEKGNIYYWKIVPKAGNITGFESEIWSFEIEIDYKPNFGISLEIDKNYLELKPGENSTINVTVGNLGKLKDNISLSIKPLNGSNIIIEILDSNFKDIEPENYIVFKILITVPIEILKGEVLFNVTAKSNEAKENWGLEIENYSLLTINILEPDIPEKPEITKKPKEKDVNTYLLFGIIILIIIVIIIVIIILMLFLMMKRKNGR